MYWIKPIKVFKYRIDKSTLRNINRNCQKSIKPLPVVPTCVKLIKDLSEHFEILKYIGIE